MPDLSRMNLELDQVNLMKRLTVEVTVKTTREKEWKIRMWIAKQLLILAAWIANMGIEFKD